MSFPTLEALWASQSDVKVNSEAGRIYWIVQPKLSEAIFVLDDIKNPSGSRQPAFRQEPSDGTPSTDPILQLTLYEPPISSVTVGVENLRLWSDFWEDGHAYFDGDDTDGPCRCCNRLPPPSGPTLIVQAGPEGYVTIGDYIASVHHWLVSLRQDLLWAVSPEAHYQLPENTKLMVSLVAPNDLVIEEPAEWLSYQRSFFES